MAPRYQGNIILHKTFNYFEVYSVHQKKSTKIRIHNRNAKPVVLYGSEFWCAIQSDLQNIFQKAAYAQSKEYIGERIS